MKVTSEMLAAYAEGKASGAERDAIRKYLADNPSELRSVMMMMDEDYDLDIEDKASAVECNACMPSFGAFHEIALSAAAFAPQEKHNRQPLMRSNSIKKRKSFESNLDDLLDDIL